MHVLVRYCEGRELKILRGFRNWEMLYRMQEPKWTVRQSLWVRI